MKFLLIVFATFHFDGGVASSTVEFNTQSSCEQAKQKVVAEHSDDRHSRWGRALISAVCVAKG